LAVLDGAHVQRRAIREHQAVGSEVLVPKETKDQRNC
jgi:hypothetical protein